MDNGRRSIQEEYEIFLNDLVSTLGNQIPARWKVSRRKVYRGKGSFHEQDRIFIKRGALRPKRLIAMISAFYSDENDSDLMLRNLSVIYNSQYVFDRNSFNFDNVTYVSSSTVVPKNL